MNSCLPPDAGTNNCDTNTTSITTAGKWVAGGGGGGGG